MSGYDFENLNVLICDDSRQIRSLLKTFLNGFGVRNITESNDANRAYEEMQNHDPDLVITDWNMPPTSGLDFVKRIRLGDDSPNPYVPIIMLTGYTELYRVKQARDAGITSFLAKPISAHSLYKRMVSIVDDQRPFVRNDKYFGPDRRTSRTMDYGGTDRRDTGE
jgi:two-component system, chemotaxis family, chemotaxis protein CheY